MIRLQILLRVNIIVGDVFICKEAIAEIIISFVIKALNIKVVSSFMNSIFTDTISVFQYLRSPIRHCISLIVLLSQSVEDGTEEHCRYVDAKCKKMECVFYSVNKYLFCFEKIPMTQLTKLGMYVHRCFDRVLKIFTNLR